MKTVQLELEDELVEAMSSLNQPMPQAARELIVMELYRRGTISSGKAAELLGLSKPEFIEHSSRCGIPYLAMTDSEWAVEREHSERL